MTQRLPLWKPEPLKKLRARRKADNKARMLEWHKQVIQKGYRTSVADVDIYECFHCGGLFTEFEIIGDHFPHTKGARPDLKYDVRNGRPCCRRCNVSGSPHRKKPTEDDLSPFYA